MLRTCCLLLLVAVCGVWPAPSDPAITPGGGGGEGAEDFPEERHPEEEWTYEAQDLWPSQFKACGGPRQSPTRLDAELRQLGSRPKLGFAPGLADGRVHAMNTGHTLQLRLSTETGGSAGADTCTDDGVEPGTGACAAGEAGDKLVPPITITSFHSPLSGIYHLEQLHYHWGDSEGTPGSEHELDGRLADAEVHFVFFNRKYGNISAALQHTDGLAVVGILLNGSRTGQERGKLTWPSLGLQGHLSRLAEVGSELTVPADLRPLQPLLEQAVSYAFSYRGSLTTPPCSPVVCWLVAARTVTVGQTFLDELRSSLYRDTRRNPLQNNWRSLQLREQRVVIKHRGLDTDGSVLKNHLGLD